MTSRTECPACGQRVILAWNPGRQLLILNWARDPAGPVAATQAASGAWHARTLTQGERPRPEEHRHALHYATSPQCRPPAADSAQAAADVVTSLDAWRKAQAAHAKAQRRRKPRQKPVTGYRVNPGRTP